jgi:DNA-binding CsgD family transcriptional regulator
MKSKNTRIGSMSITHLRYSHYCTETSGKSKRWLRDDFELQDVNPSHISVFSKIENHELIGFPFGEPAEKKRTDYKKYTLLVGDKLYMMEEIILSSEQLKESDVIHYVISPHELRVHSVGSEEEQILETLTEREIEVIVMMAKGHSMTSIAKQLYLSPHTIDSHRINLCKKLKVRRTTELAVWAYKLGLLDKEPLRVSCR